MTDLFAVPDAPAVAALVADLHRCYPAIRAEAMERLKDREYMVWPEAINLGGWGVHGLHWQGEMLQSGARVTTQLIQQHQPLLANAAFSLLLPGASIAEHVGYSGDVLRLHHCLLAPTTEGCELVVAGERRRWRDGEVFCFDDTLPHSAYNRTDQVRIVLLLDLRRDAWGTSPGTTRNITPARG